MRLPLRGAWRAIYGVFSNVEPEGDGYPPMYGEMAKEGAPALAQRFETLLREVGTPALCSSAAPTPPMRRT